MGPDYWFKPKSMGYGATPSTWQGWASVLAFVVAVVVLSFAILGSTPGLGAIALWAALVGPLTIGFAVFTRRKTDGEWRWRWRAGRGAHL